MTQFIGIDLSINSTGLVILKEDSNHPVLNKLIKTKKTSTPDYIRFIAIAKEITTYITNAKITFGEPYIVIENFAFGAVGNLTRLGELRGILSYELYAKLGCHFKLCAPSAVKKYAFGVSCPKGKGVILKSVLQRWEFDTNYDDEADAYVLAQIARELYRIESVGVPNPNLPKYQIEVLNKILN